MEVSKPPEEEVGWLQKSPVEEDKEVVEEVEVQVKRRQRRLRRPGRVLLLLKRRRRRRTRLRHKAVHWRVPQAPVEGARRWWQLEGARPRPAA